MENIQFEPLREETDNIELNCMTIEREVIDGNGDTRAIQNNIEIIDDVNVNFDSNQSNSHQNFDSSDKYHEENKIEGNDHSRKFNSIFTNDKTRDPEGHMATPDQEHHHGSYHSNWQNLIGDNIENFQHKLQDMSHKGKQQFQAFVGHLKNAPHFIIDNEYIQRGYRINFNTKSSLCKSLFMLHNESVNVWSHLIGVGCFIGLHSKMTTYGIYLEDKEQSKYWHIEGYLLDIMHVISGVPYTLKDATYIQSIINVIHELPKQLNEQVMNVINTYSPIDPVNADFSNRKIDYLKRMTSLIQDKASQWSNKIADKIRQSENATLSDWLVLGPVISDPNQVKFYVTKIPLFLHIGGAISCLGLSAIFHLFKDHSQHMGEFLVRLDYAGISLMIAGSNMPPLYYSFICKPVHYWRNIYMTAQSVSCLLVFICSLWPKFDKPKYRVLRGTLFVILGLVAVVPFTHILVFMEPQYLPYFDGSWWIFGAVLYIFGAVVYMLRVPERFFPNKFDFFTIFSMSQ
eukprot:403356144